MSKSEKTLNKSVTILIPEGIVPQAIFNTVSGLVDQYKLGVYLSTMQNIRLLDIKEEDESEVLSALQKVGAQLKKPGLFPLPKTCVGSKYCNLGLIDVFELSRKITACFKDRTNTKPKFKIALAACPASCSNALITDIGVRATRAGLEVYVGGKGGTMPQKGVRIAKGIDQEQLLELLIELVNFHDRKTSKKQRFSKLLNDPEFAFQEV